MTDQNDAPLNLAEILRDLPFFDATDLMDERAEVLAKRHFAAAMVDFAIVDPADPDAEENHKLATSRVAEAFIATAVRSIVEQDSDGAGAEAAASVLAQMLDELGFGLPEQEAQPKPYKLEKQRQKAARQAQRRNR